jgi:polysaccharide export outer membrane protein
MAQAVVPDAQQSLQPGDIVKITVWRKPELSGDFYVAADSSIADPFYAPVKVVGVPFSTALERVREFLSRTETAPRVWMEPMLRVMVGGEVRSPSIYSLRRETTLSEAVFMAGGPSDRGRLDRVQLVRAGQIRALDLTDPTGAAAAIRIDSGDRILVGRRSHVLRDYVLPTVTFVGSVAAVIRLISP